MSENRERNNIRAIRERYCLTQKDLAKATGVAVRTLWSLELGKPSRHGTKWKVLNGLFGANGWYRRREVWPDMKWTEKDEKLRRRAVDKELEEAEERMEADGFLDGPAKGGSNGGAAGRLFCDSVGSEELL